MSEIVYDPINHPEHPWRDMIDNRPIPVTPEQEKVLRANLATIKQETN